MLIQNLKTYFRQHPDQPAVSMHQTSSDIKRIFQKRKDRTLAVIDANMKFQGIIERATFTQKISEMHQPRTQNFLPASEFITHTPKPIPASIGFKESILRMVHMDLKYLPVEHNGQFIGLLQERDIRNLIIMENEAPKTDNLSFANAA